jgi:hypothetical protein
MYLPDWFSSWTNHRTPLTADARVWLAQRPLPMRELMSRFPPSCVVRSSRELYCPAPGQLAIVVAYDPQRDRVCVVAAPNHPQRVWCRADWLEVVAHWNEITPRFLAVLWASQPPTPAHLDNASL